MLVDNCHIFDSPVEVLYMIMVEQAIWWRALGHSKDCVFLFPPSRISRKFTREGAAVA